jgi:RimJ/RimL family protein N-acetyltransferase
MENYWQGKTIRLRAVEIEDAEVFVKWNLDSERGRFLDFLWPPQSVDAIKNWVATATLGKLENDSFTWVIETLDHEPAGTISTHDCDLRNGTFSFGIDIAAQYRRKGYAREAIGLVLNYYFNELRYQKVTVPIHSDNAASVALHEKLGFQLEGRFRRMMYTAGRFIDVFWYGLTAEEFKQSNYFGL